MAKLTCGNMVVDFQYDCIEYGEIYYSIELTLGGLPIINPEIFEDRYNDCKMSFTVNGVENDLVEFLERAMTEDKEVEFGNIEPPETTIKAINRKAWLIANEERLRKNKNIFVKHEDDSIKEEPYYEFVESFIPQDEITFKFIYSPEYFKFGCASWKPITIEFEIKQLDVKELINELNLEYKNFIIKNKHLIEDYDLWALENALT